MAVNSGNPDKWTADICKSVDQYNTWFMEFAPKTYRETRLQKSGDVEKLFELTSNLADITPDFLKANPQMLQILRMITCPPIARDRLIGLANVSSKNLVESMEDSENPRLPQRMNKVQLDGDLRGICELINSMLDSDIFVWLHRDECIKEDEKQRAVSIIADRLCGAISDPVIRNAQEERQLAVLSEWLNKRHYRQVDGVEYNEMAAGTYSFHKNIKVSMTESNESGIVNISIDAVVMPKKSKEGEWPLLIEAKSAGDYTNVNKRRKEEAQKINQLRDSFGDKIRYILLLCGYFDRNYLAYEAAEGIDWVWEHRIKDLAQFGL